MPSRATIRISKSLLPSNAEVGYVIGKLVVTNANSIRRGGPFFKLKSVMGLGSVVVSEKGSVSLVYLDPEAAGTLITMIVSASGVSPVPYDKEIVLSVSIEPVDYDPFSNVLYWKGEIFRFKGENMTLN